MHVQEVALHDGRVVRLTMDRLAPLPVVRVQVAEDGLWHSTETSPQPQQQPVAHELARERVRVLRSCVAAEVEALLRLPSVDGDEPLHDAAAALLRALERYETTQALRAELARVTAAVAAAEGRAVA